MTNRGAFTIPNVANGRFRNDASGLPANVYLTSARYGGVDVIDSGIDVDGTRLRACRSGGCDVRTWSNVSEAAEYAGVSRDTIYTACEQGELRSARVSGRRAIRIRPAWIDAWLERHAPDIQDRRGIGDARNGAAS